MKKITGIMIFCVFVLMVLPGQASKLEKLYNESREALNASDYPKAVKILDEKSAASPSSILAAAARFKVPGIAFKI